MVSFWEEVRRSEVLDPMSLHGIVVAQGSGIRHVTSTGSSRDGSRIET